MKKPVVCCGGDPLGQHGDNQLNIQTDNDDQAVSQASARTQPGFVNEPIRLRSP